MRPRRLIVAVAAAASGACGAFSSADVPGDAAAPIADGSPEVSVEDGARVDAAVDAASSSDAGDGGAPTVRPCTPHAPIELLAGDFDGVTSGGAIYSVLGTSFTIPPNTSGAAAGVAAPGDGTARLLHIHSTGGKYVLEAPAANVTGGACIVTSTFDIMFEGINTPGPGGPTFAVVGVRNPAFDHCYVYFQHFLSQGKLGLQSHCGTRVGGGDYNAYTTVLPAFPAGFVHVVMTLDLAQAVATLVVGGTTATLPLGTNQVVVGGPQAYAEIGLDGTTGAGFDGTIDVDSIDVEVR